MVSGVPMTKHISIDMKFKETLTSVKSIAVVLGLFDIYNNDKATVICNHLHVPLPSPHPLITIKLCMGLC